MHESIKFVTHCQVGDKALRQAIDAFNKLDIFEIITASSHSVHDAALAFCSKLGP